MSKTVATILFDAELYQFNHDGQLGNERQNSVEVEELPTELNSNGTRNEVPSIHIDGTVLDGNRGVVNQDQNTDIPIDPLSPAIRPEGLIITTYEVEINEPNVTTVNGYSQTFISLAQATSVRRSTPAGYLSRYNPNMVAHNLGSRTSICPFCSAIHFAAEPVHARPNTGETWGNSAFQFDNRWVVTYNAYLTKKHNAHINVEVARGVQAVKYHAKYVYKGSDLASLTVDEQYDEIAMTMHGRYISPVQATAKLSGPIPPFILGAIKTPTLQFSKEFQFSANRQLMMTKIDDNAKQAQVKALELTSPFIDWMKYKAENEDGRDLLYGEFPSYFTYHKSRGWQKRRNGYSIGRMPVAVPRQGEHFYLRTLLTVKRGARSFRDLYTVNGVYCGTASSACRALGLVFDDSDWVSLFEEVKDSSSASSLRQTFAAAIMHSAIISPQDLWDRFKIPFTDDCLWRMGTLGDRVVREENAFIVEAMDVDRDSEAAMHSSALTVLSTGQRAAYDTIVSSIERGLGHSIFFLQGAAGTGKTFLYKTLSGLYKSQSKIVLCVASSGIAALLLPNGRTAHSVFRIPLDCPENAVCNIGGQDHLADLLRQTSLIIWDEVTMQQKNDFAAVDKSLRDIKKKVDVMFGGIPIVSACIRSWSLWPNIKTLFLTENMRVISGDDNQRFAEWLARLSYDTDLYGPIEIPEWIQTTSDRNLFREFIYPKREFELGGTDLFEDRMILTGLNESVDRFNQEIAEIRASEAHVYYACDKVESDESGQSSDCPVEVLRTLQVKGLPDGRLKLQIGMPVMLL
ncbi:hypothetical protein EPUL_003563, partial [Erysiphe pulchra]